MRDFKHKIIRSGLAKLVGQAANFVLRLGFIVTMARLLNPADFGLVAMVTVITGIYELFTTAGLSMATVQKDTISEAQISTLFWVNIAVGAALGLLCFATAPVLVAFYGESRLFWVAAAMGIGFLFSGAGVQHHALLQRKLRYVSLTVIDTISHLTGIGIAVVMALNGYGYWSLVAASVSTPLIMTLMLWSVTGWIPGLPSRNSGIRSMLGFGATVTLNGLVVYIAYNLDKVLLGRFWGAEALGIYSRAYQLINIPTVNLNQAIGSVTFSALSRLQNDPNRLKKYFLNGYGLVLSLTLPTTLFFELFSDDIILVALGPNWMEAAAIFRLLAPTILIFGIINPLGWFLYAIGKQRRSLHIALALVPVVVTGYLVGLPYGPQGVALGYSIAMGIWLVPHVYWCLHDTMVSPKDLLRTASKPIMACLIAMGVVLAANHFFGQVQHPINRLALGGTLMAVTYAWVLLFAFGQKELYYDLLKGLKTPAA
jgi:O-antigen/teichoic acid export membrane protein